MPVKSSKFLPLFFLLLSIIMVLFLFFGMVANTKTVEISKKMRVANVRLSKLKKENKELELYILREHSPLRIRQRAETQLSLNLPVSIEFFSTHGDR